MYIIKRDGSQQSIQFDKITERNLKQSSGLNLDIGSLSQTVIKGIVSGMTTKEIDELSCESAIHLSIYEPDYAILASRIACDNLHKSTCNLFDETIDKLYNHINHVTNKSSPLICPLIYEFAKENKELINLAIDYSKDYKYSYFGFKTLEKSYLQKIKGQIVERPQDMLMRVALGIHGPSKDYIQRKSINQGITIYTDYLGVDIQKALQTYKDMSDMKFTHASPTLFNSGTTNPQMSSCFLLTCPDNLNNDEDHPNSSIATCWNNCSAISKGAGGIGIDITPVRCRGSYISGTNGRSNGIIPLIKVFNNIARYVDQGGGKRKGAFSLSLQPWHPDTPEFLEIKLNTTTEELSARDIFTAMWIPDLFFKRLQEGISHNNEGSYGDWNFFCPSICPDLISLYGEEFEKKYIEYESLGKSVRKMKASKLFEMILKSLIETGTPYMMSKDSVNKKSNQKNISFIPSTNLCTEIVEVNNPESIAVCNLASICLPRFIKTNRSIEFEIRFSLKPNLIDFFDFKELGRIVEQVTENLNLIIDKNRYPVEFAKKNNLENRPIGIGVQGLADVFASLKYSWESDEAKKLNQIIFEVIYFHALKESCRLAKEQGKYKNFNGSPASQGILQYDMWNIIPITQLEHPRLNWKELKDDIQKYGLRNSLLVALMPTASTSNIMNNNECFEPYTSNIYTRKVICGDFPLVNPYLYKDLLSINKWNKENVNRIIIDRGSVKNLDIPQNLKDVYKTVWEIPQKTIIDMAVTRGAFIDQSQSMNIFIDKPTISKLSSMYMYAWSKGLKTLSYYLRSLPAVDPVKFSILDISDPTLKIREQIIKNKKSQETKNVEIQTQEQSEYICNDEVCMVCSS